MYKQDGPVKIRKEFPTLPLLISITFRHFFGYGSFQSGSGSYLFFKSGSGSGKNPDRIRKNSDPDPDPVGNVTNFKKNNFKTW